MRHLLATGQFHFGGALRLASYSISEPVGIPVSLAKKCVYVRARFRARLLQCMSDELECGLEDLESNCRRRGSTLRLCVRCVCVRACVLPRANFRVCERE